MSRFRSADTPAMTRRSLLGVAGIAAIGSGADAGEVPRSYGLCVNEDNSHFFLSRSGGPFSKDAAAKLVTGYAQSEVGALMMCPNAQRVNYKSKVWESPWNGFEPDTDRGRKAIEAQRPASRDMARAFITTAWKYDQAGIDVYAVWVEQCRKVGISPWTSLRMNDGHDLDYIESFLHSEYWRTHPELWISGGAENKGSRAFDYEKAAVREYYYSLIEEVVSRYDVDGLELDWMRDLDCFQPGREEIGASILTSFVEKVRHLLNAKERVVKHKIRLGVRVPSKPKTAKLLGFDAGTWARKGLVDHVVATPRWASSECDIPVEEWREALGPHVTLAAGLELLMRPYAAYPKRLFNTLETARGMAAGFLRLGVDEIYLFNYMDSGTTITPVSHYPLLISECGRLETLSGKERRHVITYSDTWARGEKVISQLPMTLTGGGPRSLKIACGPRPTSEAAVLLGGAGMSPDALGQLDVKVKGVSCPFRGMRQVAQPAPEFGLAAFGVAPKFFDEPYMIVNVAPGHGASSAPLTIQWAELSVTA